MSQTDRTSTRQPSFQSDPPSVASSLGTILAIFLLVTGALIAVEYPAAMLALLAGGVVVLTAVRFLADFSVPQSASRPFGRIIRFGPRRRYRL
ncbi:hypothetical protein SAMN04488066_107117 [Halorubrum aquaticum]|uniref:Uncharacterized protein n=1 Tax=Halorubrum aquaticum TaxID=387340 RepID=A0A1I3AU69_9EURY|nr:hypothetical protein [Halorubrum aquaticum]SFH53553.1 hypothetical protein SAMN04488066_107117 [Halorubrum aquaticum]